MRGVARTSVRGSDRRGRLAFGQRAHDPLGKSCRRLDGAQHAPQFVFDVVHGNSSAVMSCAPTIFPRNAVSDRLM